MVTALNEAEIVEWVCLFPNLSNVSTPFPLPIHPRRDAYTSSLAGAVIINESDTHFPGISLPPTPTVDSSYQYGPEPWIDQFPVLDSVVILVVGIIGLTFLTLMIVLLQFMIFGTRKKKRLDNDEANEIEEGGVVGGGVGSRGRGRGRRRKPLYRYGVNRVDAYMDPRMWEGTGNDIEGVWFPLEGTGDEEKKRVIWEDGEPDELSYGKEAIFLMEEPRHAYC